MKVFKFPIKRGVRMCPAGQSALRISETYKHKTCDSLQRFIKVQPQDFNNFKYVHPNKFFQLMKF